MLEEILKEIGLTRYAASIYLQLIDTGPQTARRLAENLGLPRPTVYDNLKILISKGLATEIEEENKKVFSIDDPKNLPQLLHSKIANLQKQEQILHKILPKLAEAKSIEPKIKLFVGPEGVKQVLTDIIWYENIKTLTMWPISDMIEILGKDYMEELNRRRIRHKIWIRGIWPRDKAINFKDYPFMGIGKGFLRSLRFAPKGMSWDMSYWLYKDKVAFISSKQELFGFVIHSRDFANLLRAQFKVIWKLSTPIKAQPKYTDKFLETL